MRGLPSGEGGQQGTGEPWDAVKFFRDVRCTGHLGARSGGGRDKKWPGWGAACGEDTFTVKPKLLHFSGKV